MQGCALQYEPTPSLVPYTDRIDSTASHKEQYLSSRHPDRCLHAMLAFIGYGWSRILCPTGIRLRTLACVPFFRLFCSYLALSASDRRPTPPYSHTYTQQQNPYPKGNFLSAERGSNPWYHAWTPLPRVPLVYVSQRKFFSAACLFDTSTCSCDTRYDISASQQINYLLAPPCVCSVLCKHVLCCCTTIRTV